MASFVYQVRDQRGRKLKGVLEAVSEKNAAEDLVRQGYLITKIIQTPHGAMGIGRFAFSAQIPSDDFTMFYFQLANIVEAGIPLVKALETVSGQLHRGTLKRIIQDLASRITGGESFSEAMSHHGRAFPFLYQCMIRVGETSGHLAQTLRHIADLNESADVLRHEVRSALTYPIILIFASIAVVVFMMIWIVPSFTQIFNRAGIPLPLPTRLVFNVSLWLKQQPFLILGAFLGSGVVLRLLLRLPKIKYAWDRFLLSLPTVGPFFQRVEIARWSRNMSLMLTSGVPILQTLEITQDLTQNLVYREAFAAIHSHVQQGGKLADILEQTKVFSPDVIQMISTGENSGTLDKMLLKVAQFYDQLIARTLKKVTGMIEPIFILFLGGVVGFIMLAILLPIFDMLKIFSPH